MRQSDKASIATWLAQQLGLAGPEVLEKLRQAQVDNEPPTLLERLCQSGAISPAQQAALNAIASQLIALYKGSGRTALENTWPEATKDADPADDTLPASPPVAPHDALSMAKTDPAAAQSSPEKANTLPAPMRAESASGDDLRVAFPVETTGRYEVRQEIGRGGQALVMLALDRCMGREIALKETRSEDDIDTDPGGEGQSHHISRFLREARITAQLEHPNIVPVYELGIRKDGTLYYTMRLVRGQTLKKKLQSCQNLRERLRLLGSFWDVCSALAFAHSSGVVHRDLKPANIMVGEFGETVLLDWGLARVKGAEDPGRKDLAKRLQKLQELAEDEVHGWPVGTPSYMSPEQARGEIDEIDERSDVWGLGAVLYEILTGRPPFGQASAPLILQQVLNENPQPVLSICHDAPVELAAIAGKALSKPKESRYQTAKEFAEDIAAFMTGGRVRAYEYTSWELLGRFAKRNKSAMVASGLVLVMILASLVTVMLAYRNEAVARKAERQERLSAHYHLAQAYAKQAEHLIEDKNLLSARIFAAASLLNNPANRGSPVYSPDFERLQPKSKWLRTQATSQLFQARYSPVTRLLRTHTLEHAVSQVLVSPDGSTMAAADMQGMVYQWDVTSGRELTRFRARRARQAVMAFSPDGTRLATTTDGSQVEVRGRGQDRILARLSGFPGRVVALAYAPDAKSLAVGMQHGRLQIVNATTGARIKELSPHADDILEVTFSPDGRWTASSGWDNSVNISTTATGELRHKLDGGSSLFSALAFSPDGRLLATTSLDNTLRLWDVDSGRQRAIRTSRDALACVAYSRDGTRLATGGQAASIQVMDAAGGRLLSALKGHGDLVSTVAFSPDGRLVLTGSWDRTIRVWEWAKHDGLIHLEHGEDDVVRGLTFSRDGRLVATGGSSGTVRLWEAASGRLLHSIKCHKEEVRALDFSPDGKLLATGSADTTIRLWNVQLGTSVSRLAGHTSNVYNVAFSPDGKLLVSAGLDHTARLWEVATGKEIALLKGHNDLVWDAKFSPDGRHLATACSDHQIRVWDVRSRKLAMVLEAHSDWVHSVTFSPDGKSLLSAGKDHLAMQWDLSTWRPAKRFSAHRRAIGSSSLSGDGRLLATAGDDGLALVWDVASGQPLLELRTSSGIERVALSPDGRQLAFTSDTAAIVYPFTTEPVRNPYQVLYRAEQAAGMRLVDYELEPIETH